MILIRVDGSTAISTLQTNEVSSIGRLISDYSMRASNTERKEIIDKKCSVPGVAQDKYLTLAMYGKITHLAEICTAGKIPLIPPTYWLLLSIFEINHCRLVWLLGEG
jgi:hypothetical protein